MTGRLAAGDGQLRTGVIGVGSMGRNHARVYCESPTVSLVGVHDADEERATAVASKYGTRSVPQDELLAAVDAVSVAVPTPYHAEVVRACLENGVHVLVEKPYVDDLEEGRALATLARDERLVLQVGHIERFNPATRVLADVVPDLDVVSIDVQRLGPPVERVNEDSVIMDLMVHDLDILLSLVDSEIETLTAVAHDDRHASAQLRFADDSLATLTASRLTQQKVRKLTVTAMSCWVDVDFISQSVEIHRRSSPEYVEAKGDVRYRHESVVERPMVENGEPLKNELVAFERAIRDRTRPLVTAEDALDVLALAGEIETAALGVREEVAAR